MDFTGRIIVERTRPRERASVKEQGFCLLSLKFYIINQSLFTSFIYFLSRICVSCLCRGKQLVWGTYIRYRISIKSSIHITGKGC